MTLASCRFAENDASACAAWQQRRCRARYAGMTRQCTHEARFISPRSQMAEPPPTEQVKSPIRNRECKLRLQQDRQALDCVVHAGDRRVLSGLARPRVDIRTRKVARHIRSAQDCFTFTVCVNVNTECTPACIVCRKRRPVKSQKMCVASPPRKPQSMRSPKHGAGKSWLRDVHAAVMYPCTAV